MKKAIIASKTPIDKALARRIREARVRAGYRNALDAAKAMGVPKGTYYAHESDKPETGRIAKAMSLELYARTFGVTVEWLKTGASNIKRTDDNIKKFAASQPTGSKINVLGVARAGAWLEVDALNQTSDEPWQVSVPGEAAANRFGVLIRGRSMSKVLDDGDVAICIEWATVGREPKDGDILLVERHRAGLIETTVKRYRDGQLWGESNDPNWNKPIPLGSTKGEEIIIRGLVISLFRPLTAHASNAPPPYMMLDQ
jgi:phage repressor protein C with HTH and peptisase S24 domain